MKDHLLTFELNDDGDMLEIHGDQKGLEYLAEILLDLAKEESADHAHLMTDDWGGSGLSNEVQGVANNLLNSTKIFIWPKM